MRRWVIALAFGLALTGTAHAADDFTAVLSSRVWSKYLSQGGVVVHQDPVVWTDIFVLSPWGFYVDVWNSTGLDGTNPNSDFGDEIDWFVGWTGKSGNVGFNLGVAYFDIHKLFGSSRDDLLQLYGEVAYTLTKEYHAVTPFFRLEYTSPIPGTTDAANGSVRLLTGAAHSWALDPKVSLEHKLWLIYDDGGAFLSEAGVVQYQVGLLWKLSDRVNLELPTVKLSTPITRVRDDRKFEGILGGGIVIRF